MTQPSNPTNTMPDPTAHADDMKSLAVIEPNTSPAFWWVNPWGYALNLKRALDAVYLLSETTEDAYQAATTVIKQKQELADYHRNNLNTFQRKVEVTLKPACPHLYEDTIGYVQWAADEIKALRASLSVITEDRDAYIGKVQELKEEQQGLLHEARTAIAEAESLRCDLQKIVIRNSDDNVASGRRILEQFKERDDEIDELQAELDAVKKHRNRALKDLEICQKRIEKLEGKRKPAKKKAKYGDARDGYAAFARKVLKRLAKKKGGRRA